VENFGFFKARALTDVFAIKIKGGFGNIHINGLIENRIPLPRILANKTRLVNFPLFFYFFLLKRHTENFEKGSAFFFVFGG
jgi:hypothetical protein